MHAVAGGREEDGLTEMRGVRVPELDLAGDELVELTGLSNDRAQELIMKARAHWFESAEAPADA